MSGIEWDIFICHASEDKKFVRPLAVALNSLGVEVWYDEFSLELGDSLSQSIDKGLSKSRYGLVVISLAFIGKGWTEYELKGLVTKEIGGPKVILPIWHGVTVKEVKELSLPLADKLAFKTDEQDIDDIIFGILKVVRPDIYETTPRSDLEKISTGDALRELREELEEYRYFKDEFSCPFCGSELATREFHEESSLETYVCGYCVGDHLNHPCPYDPEFPTLDDYELETRYRESSGIWDCFAKPKTKRANKLKLSSTWGNTSEQAKERMRKAYEFAARNVPKNRTKRAE